MYVNLEIINEGSGNVEKEEGHDETADRKLQSVPRSYISLNNF